MSDTPQARDPSSPINRAEQAEGLPQRGEVGTILLVDDEELLLRAARLILRNDGFNVLTYTCAAEALSAHESELASLDLVVTDNAMPNMTGLQFARKLRELDPALPIVLASGYAREDNSKLVGEGLLQGFLPKPYSSDNLSAIVRDVLRKHGRSRPKST